VRNYIEIRGECPLFHSKVNEKKLIIAPNNITEGGEYILQNLIPLMSNEYHKIQCLIIIVVVDKDGYYNKSIATQNSDYSNIPEEFKWKSHYN